MKKHIPKILIVDDDQLYLTQFKTILSDEIQANYYFSDNANDAVELINKNCFAIILLDVNIPEKSGFELAKDVRSSKLNKYTPIIFITGVSIDNHSILEGYKAGAVDYLSKPVNRFILFSKINTFLMLDLQSNELVEARHELKKVNKDLEKQVEQRTQQLTRAKALLNIQHTIDFLSSIEKGQKCIFNNIINSIFEFDWVDSAGIYLMDKEEQDLTLVSHKGLSKEFVNRSKYFPKESAQTKLVLSKKPFYSSYEKSGEFPDKETQKENIKALAVIPLIDNKKVIGSLNVASKTKEELSEIEKNEIESLSPRIGNLIVYAQTQGKLKIYQNELEQKIRKRTKVLREANIKLNEEIEFHKETKIALAESEYKYRGIFENAQDGIVLYDAETLELVEMNRKAYDDLGYTSEEFKNLKYGEFIIYKDENERRELVEQLISKGIISFQAKHRKKNGEICHRIVNASVLMINDKKYIQGFIHDISEIKKNEIALHKSEEKYRALQSNISFGMWMTEPGGKFLYANEAVIEMLGYDSEEELFEIHASDLYFDKNKRREVIEILKLKDHISNEEVQFVRKDKSVFWASMNVKAVFDNEGKLIRLDGITENISEKKNVQSKLLRAHEEIKKINRNLKKEIHDALKEEKKQHQYMMQKSKIESLGELAAGIAHEINQPLGVMSLSTQNLQMKLTSNNATPEYINEKLKSIESNIHRIKNIVDHVRTFSHEATSFSLEKVVVNKGISNALLLIGTQYKNHNIDIKLELQENIGFTVGSKQKFEQVMLNLLSNAKYAVDERAINYSETEYKKVITINTKATKKRITVFVEDNGVGIKSENVTKVLDPFYTSKPEGIGTGLGLSIVYGIIKEMRGEIIIDSKWGKYTKVKISFPRFPENT